MMAWVVLAMVAAVASGDAQASVSPAVALDQPPLALSAPTAKDMVVTKRIERPMPDGTVATFRIDHRLRFVQGEGGMIATMERTAIDCVAAEAMCTRFNAALSPGIGNVRRFAVGRDGAIQLLAGTYAVAEGSHPGRRADPAAIVRAVEREVPGALSIEEMREAVRFIGQRLVVGATVADGGGSQVARVDSISDGVARLSAEEVSEPVSGVIMRRRRTWTVDLASGLVRSSEIRTTRVNSALAAGGPEPLVDVWHWDLVQ